VMLKLIEDWSASRVVRAGVTPHADHPCITSETESGQGLTGMLIGVRSSLA
jgi:hypothetical protein